MAVSLTLLLLGKTILSRDSTTRANLRGANLAWKNLYQANLIGVDLSKVDLSRAILHGMSLSSTMRLNPLNGGISGGGDDPTQQAKSR